MQKLISNKKMILAFVIIITLLARCVIYYEFREFNSDKARQLHGAYSLMHHKGVSFESYDLNTFTSSTHSIVDWPPGYSFITAAISYITGANLYTASVILDYLVIISLWLVMWWFVVLLNFSTLQATLLFIFVGISKTILEYIYSADLLGILLFLASVALLLQYFRYQERSMRQKIFFYAAQFILICGMIFLKYSLLPVAGCVAFSLLWYQYRTNKKLTRFGLSASISLLAAIALLFIYNYSRSGHATGMHLRYTTEVKGLHFANLLYCDPFIVKAFLFMDPLFLRFNTVTVNWFAQALTVLVLLFVSARIIKRIVKKEAEYFDYLVFSATIFIGGFLAGLSVKYPADRIGDTYIWTYVREFRYFAPLTFVYILYLFRGIDFTNTTTFSKKFFSWVTACCVFIAVVLQSYYWSIKNFSTSFSEIYGKVFKVYDQVKSMSDENTYFVSLSGDEMFDAQLTSLAAVHDTKVTMSYYQYFPAEQYKILFDSTKKITHGKKIIIYSGGKEPDPINAQNNHRSIINGKEHYTIIEN